MGRLENAGTGRAVRGVYLKGSGCVHSTSLQAMKAVEKGYIRDVRDLQRTPYVKEREKGLGKPNALSET